MCSLYVFIVLTVAYISVNPVKGQIIFDGSCPVDDIKPSPQADAKTIAGVYNVVAYTTEANINNRKNSQARFESNDTINIEVTSSFLVTSSECGQVKSFMEPTDKPGLFNLDYLIDGEYQTFQFYILAIDSDLTSFATFGCRNIPEDNTFQAQVTVFTKTKTTYDEETKDLVKDLLENNGLSLFNDNFKEVSHVSDKCKFES